MDKEKAKKSLKRIKRVEKIFNHFVGPFFIYAGIVSLNTFNYEFSFDEQFFKYVKAVIYSVILGYGLACFLSDLTRTIIPYLKRQLSNESIKN